MHLIDQAMTENNIYLIYANRRFQFLKAFLKYKKMLTEAEVVNILIQIHQAYTESYTLNVSRS